MNYALIMAMEGPTRVLLMLFIMLAAAKIMAESSSGCANLPWSERYWQV